MRRIFSTPFLALPLLFGLVSACGETTDEEPPTTVPTGGGTADTTQWAGRTFILTVPQANWSEPRGLGEQIGPFVPSFLISFVDAMGTVTLTTANAAGQQEMCNPTTSTAVANVPYPNSSIGPVNFPIHIKHVNEPGLQVNATIYNLALLNVIPGEMPATDGELTAVMDMRDLYPMFTLLSSNPTPDSVCAALESGLGVPCESCPQDSAAYCLSIKAVLLGAADWQGTIVPVAPGSTDASCVGANQMAPAQ